MLIQLVVRNCHVRQKTRAVPPVFILSVVYGVRNLGLGKQKRQDVPLCLMVKVTGHRNAHNVFKRLCIQDHRKFSPFSGEPVVWIIDSIDPEMLVFASDYLHPKGTAGPIKRFERSMPNCDQEVMKKFYYGNMLELMGGA